MSERLNGKTIYSWILDQIKVKESLLGLVYIKKLEFESNFVKHYSYALNCNTQHWYTYTLVVNLHVVYGRFNFFFFLLLHLSTCLNVSFCNKKFKLMALYETLLAMINRLKETSTLFCYCSVMNNKHQFINHSHFIE